MVRILSYAAALFELAEDGPVGAVVEGDIELLDPLEGEVRREFEGWGVFGGSVRPVLAVLGRLAGM